MASGYKLPNLPAVMLAVVVWSFLWTCLVGHFGIFAIDQGIVFDGGWRILSGQVPFKDFLMAFGPVTFVIQALFFKLFGVSWTSTVLSAAFIGSAAALSTMRIMRILFGAERVWLIGWAGFLVGTSFQAMFGTLWMEQTAFFFGLLGIQVICESLRTTPRRRLLYFALAGVLATLSFLSKQNAGVLSFGLLCVLTVLVALPGPLQCLKALCCLLLGVAAATGIFALWLIAFSNPHLFIRHALEVPSHVGRGRVSFQKMLYVPYLLSYIRGATQWCYALAFGAAFRALYLAFADRDFRAYLWRSAACRLSIGLAVGIPFVQSVFQMTTMNQAFNVLSLSGLSLALGVGLLTLLPAAGKPGRWTTALAGCITCFLVFEMVYHGWNRDVQDAFPSGAAHLSRPLRARALANVLWISPTITHGEVIDPETINAVVDYVRASKQNFLLLGDSSYLYGVTGVVPPQPLLYLQENHYFLGDDVPFLDDWILANLKKKDIRLIVREIKNYEGRFPFPLSVKWVDDNFHRGPRFGNFEILLR